MQPKNVPCHIRIKVEPTQKQRGRACRLHGKDFKSIADAASIGKWITRGQQSKLTGE